MGNRSAKRDPDSSSTYLKINDPPEKKLTVINAKNFLCAKKQFDNCLCIKVLLGNVFDEPADITVICLNQLTFFTGPFLDQINTIKHELMAKITGDDRKTPQYNYTVRVLNVEGEARRFLFFNLPKATVSLLDRRQYGHL